MLENALFLWKKTEKKNRRTAPKPPLASGGWGFGGLATSWGFGHQTPILLLLSLFPIL